MSGTGAGDSSAALKNAALANQTKIQSRRGFIILFPPVGVIYAPQETESKALTIRDRFVFMSILVHFLVGHALHECFAVRVEGDRHSLGTTSASIFGYP
jgi:hypothetical protein